jgi:hypothetical protein
MGNDQGHLEAGSSYHIRISDEKRKSYGRQKKRGAD